MDCHARQAGLAMTNGGKGLNAEGWVVTRIFGADQQRSAVNPSGSWRQGFANTVLQVRGMDVHVMIL